MEAVKGGAATRHVLVVDDDEMMRTIARAVLEKVGMRVTESKDGADALARFGAGETFSLVLLDLNMPNVGGIDVLRSIRSTPAIADLPVLILSGADTDREQAVARAAGADDFVTKPIVPARLLASVEAVLSRR